MRDRPNIVLINCDDLGYGDLGCYGSTVHDTPALDRMASEGMRMTDFYMASPVCSPSRGAMLTGCYPARIGFDDFDGIHVLFPGMGVGLNPSEITIARLLQESGYATSMVGKWHCGDQPDFLPTRHGFDHWLGIPYSNDMGIQATEREMTAEDRAELEEKLGIKLPTPYRVPLPLLLDDEIIEAQPDQATLTSRYLQESVRFMRENRDRPFFLYFAHMYVHLPIYVQERFAAASRNGPYGAAVACIDWAADVLLHELQALGLDEDTIMIFTSDNGALARPGEGSNGPLRANKGTTWEGGQRVPCIVRGPGLIPAGVESSILTTAMDLYPTIAAWCGVDLPTDRVIDGRDIGEVLQGRATASPHDAFYYYSGSNLEAVRAGNWKLHVYKTRSHRGEQGPTEELYDLTADIGETSNVVADHPDVVARLHGLLDQARQDLGDAVEGVEGHRRRPVGRVANPVPLAELDPAHPYYMAEYDLTDRG
ncbi:MAG: sulfatase [Actinomycetia bacterium]|nr:sulfatase [Actinomycetes bacterium]